MIDIWDPDYQAVPWSLNPRRLSRAPEVVAHLTAALQAEPSVSGRLVEVSAAPERSQGALFLSGRWLPGATPVLVKLDCSALDLFWMRAIAVHDPGLMPTLLASGDRLAGAEVRWVLMERVPHHLGSGGGQIRRDVWDSAAEAAVRFQRAAAHVAEPLAFRTDAAAIRDFVTRAVKAEAPGPAARLLDRLDDDWRWLERTCALEVNFGDLHFGNALCRTPSPEPAEAVLIDPIPRICPWAFDPAYCQTLQADTDIHLVHRVARLRAAQGLPVPDGPDLDRAATLLLGWLSAMWWGFGAWPRRHPKWVVQTERYIRAACDT